MTQQRGQTRYRVVREIDLDADNPEAAALAARRLQLDPAAQVGALRVTDELGAAWSVDLDDSACPAAPTAQEGGSDG